MAGQDNRVTSQPNIDVSATSGIGNILSGNEDKGQREHAQPHSQDSNQHEPEGAGPRNDPEVETDSTLHIPPRLLNNLDRRFRV